MVERVWGPDIDKSKKYSPPPPQHTHTHTHTHNEINNPTKKTRMFLSFKNTVPDPDLELRGGGGFPPPPKFFGSLGPLVRSPSNLGSKISGGRGGGGLSSGSATEITLWVSDNQIIDWTSASVLLNSVLKIIWLLNVLYITFIIRGWHQLLWKVHSP